MNQLLYAIILLYPLYLLSNTATFNLIDGNIQLSEYYKQTPTSRDFELCSSYKKQPNACKHTSSKNYETLLPQLIASKIASINKQSIDETTLKKLLTELKRDIKHIMATSHSDHEKYYKLMHAIDVFIKINENDIYLKKIKHARNIVLLLDEKSKKILRPHVSTTLQIALF